MGTDMLRCPMQKSKVEASTFSRERPDSLWFVLPAQLVLTQVDHVIAVSMRIQSCSVKYSLSSPAAVAITFL